MALRLHTLGALGALAALAAGCADRRRDDSELDGLVNARAEAPAAIDVDDAASNAAELVRALAVPHHQFELGAHSISATSSVVVTSGGKPVEALSDRTEIAVDAEGNYRATADNDREYGRHAIYAGGVLYLRPRYGRYHAREPNIPAEPGQILDEMFSTASATFDLLWTGAELSDRGAANAGGRAARAIDLSKAPTPRDRPAETATQRKWRESIGVDAISGKVVLDGETGAPLSVAIEGSLHYVRDGQRFEMTLSARHEITVGEVSAIAAPPPAKTVSAPAITSEVAERKKLLEGLSSSTGSEAPPAPAPRGPKAPAPKAPAPKAP